MKIKMIHFIQRSILVILTLALALPVQFVIADDISETQGFRKQVKLAGIREHQAALQAISDANGGNRVALRITIPRLRRAFERAAQRKGQFDLADSQLPPSNR